MSSAGFRSRTCASACFLAACLAGPARAGGDGLRIRDLGVRGGTLEVVVSLEPGFDAATRASIERGLPVTVRFTTEIWRKRRLWFDKQIDSRVISFRVRYDPGEKLFSVTGSGRPRRRETFETLDAALDQLSPRMLEVHPRGSLKDGDTYYVTVEMAIQPLTLEEFRELEGWVSGRIRGGAGSGDDEEEGDGGAVPAEGNEGDGVSGAFFHFLVKLAGFGDEIHEVTSLPFRPGSLRGLAPFPEPEGGPPGPGEHVPGIGGSGPGRPGGEGSSSGPERPIQAGGIRSAPGRRPRPRSHPEKDARIQG